MVVCYLCLSFLALNHIAVFPTVDTIDRIVSAATAVVDTDVVDSIMSAATTLV